MELRKGDVVICIDNSNRGHKLKIDAHYTILNSFMVGPLAKVTLAEFPEVNYYARRFKVIQAKCVCQVHQLTWGGCVCGAFQRENDPETTSE